MRSFNLSLRFDLIDCRRPAKRKLMHMCALHEMRFSGSSPHNRVDASCG